MNKNIHIIRIDKCLDDKISDIAELFDLKDYKIAYDEHYVCPKCMEDIWE
jgi:hypothetical protein